MSHLTIFANNFEEKAYKERLFFKNLRDLHNLFPEEHFDVDVMPISGQEHYDVIVRSKKEYCYKRILIEIKIRDEVYSDGYVYEKSKHTNLMIAKNLDPENNTVFYICSTPIGTYVWNIDKLMEEGKLILTSKKMNKATCISTKDKEDKKCYLLKPEDAHKYYKYHFSEEQFINEKAIKYIKEEKIKNKINEDKCIFGGLLNKKNNI